jgi:isoleucyl-tRNA synthetase
LIGVKTPLAQLVVIHKDQEYLDDVALLLQYVKEELNVRDVVLSTDEDKYGVVYRLNADWQVLGKKLRKDMAKVKKGLSDVTNDEVKAFFKSGEISVAGIPLTAGDLVVTRDCDASKLEGFHSCTDSDAIVLLDTTIHPHLQQEGLAREVVNRVQRLRKQAGLQATDDVAMQYKLLDDKAGLQEAIVNNADLFVRSLRSNVVASDGANSGEVIIEEEQEVAGSTFLLTLLKL